jgi:hypothetical protein
MRSSGIIVSEYEIKKMQYWIDDLEIPGMRKRSVLDVAVIETELRVYLLMDETPNKGYDLSKAAEYLVPQVVQRLGLQWSRCVFIDIYHSTELNLDPYFDQLFLDAPEEYKKTMDKKVVYKASFQEPPYRPIGLSLAHALEEMGVQVTRYQGKRGCFSLTGGDDIVQRDIGAYDGRRYYDTEGQPISGWLKSILEE